MEGVAQKGNLWLNQLGGAIMSQRRSKPLLTDKQWKLIEPLLPVLPRSKKGGRPWAPNRAVLEGILWVLRTGARWQDLPE